MARIAGVGNFTPAGGQPISFPSSVEIGCSDNFTISGSPNMTCQANGTFDQIPSCEPVTTPAPTTTSTAPAASSATAEPTTPAATTPAPTANLTTPKPTTTTTPTVYCNPPYVNMVYSTNLTATNGSAVTAVFTPHHTTVKHRF